MTILLSVTPKDGFGAERILRILLSEWPKDGPPICLLAPSGTTQARLAIEHPAIDFVPLSLQKDSLLAARRAVTRLVDRFSAAQGVLAWGTRALPPAAALARKLNCHVSASLHDHPRAEFHGRLRQWVTCQHLQHCQQIFCVSHALAAEVCPLVDTKIAVSVLQNGLPDVAEFATRWQYEKRDPPHDGNRIRIAFAGLHSSVKGFETVRNWAQACPEADWHLYGAVNPASVWPNAPTQVAIHGWTDSDEIFRANDVLVHPSIGFDALPTALIEAARAGAPAVASRVGGSEEIIDDGVTGLLFDDLQDGLARVRSLIEDCELRQRMGAAARAHYERCWTPERMVAAYVEALGGP